MSSQHTPGQAHKASIVGPGSQPITSQIGTTVLTRQEETHPEFVQMLLFLSYHVDGEVLPELMFSEEGQLPAIIARAVSVMGIALKGTHWSSWGQLEAGLRQSEVSYGKGRRPVASCTVSWCSGESIAMDIKMPA